MNGIRNLLVLPQIFALFLWGVAANASSAQSVQDEKSEQLAGGDTQGQSPKFGIKRQATPQTPETHDEPQSIGDTTDVYKWILSAIAVMLTVITMIIGVMTSFGVFFIQKVGKEKEQLEIARQKLLADQEDFREKLGAEFAQMMEAMKRTSFGLGAVVKAKADLGELLDEENPDVATVYQALAKTVRYPDLECVRLYARALAKFEDDRDIIRVVRNGILEFVRDPRVGDFKTIRD